MKNRDLLPWLLTGAGILILILSTTFYLFSVHSQILSLIELEARQALSFIQMRLLGYSETLSILKSPPPFLKDPAWLIDEFQAQPLINGVLLWDRDKILLNSFPKGKIPNRDLISYAKEGIACGESFYISSPCELAKGKEVMVLVSIDTSTHWNLWKRSLLYAIIISSLGILIMLFLAWIIVQKDKEERLMKRRLEDAETLATAGRLASFLAHELRNPLNSLKMGMQYMEELYPEKGGLIGQLRSEVDRISKIVIDFLDMAKGIKISLAKIYIQDLKKEIQKEFSNWNKEREVLRMEFPFQFSFFADKRRLYMALSNLIRNGLEAIDLRIGSVNVKSWKEDDNVYFLIKDNGKGFEAEILKNAFRPFYSSKPSGSGLGLYLAKCVAQAHGGDIEIESGSEGAEILFWIKDLKGDTHE